MTKEQKILNFINSLTEEQAEKLILLLPKLLKEYELHNQSFHLEQSTTNL